MFEASGYVLAVFIGLSLGLIGGGGSILTVPLLVYVFHVEPVSATAYSLFVVGVTSLIGAFAYVRKNQVDFKAAAVFAVPALSSVFVTRRFVLPALPEGIFSVGDFLITKNILVMGLFAVLMLASSYSMIKNKRPETEFNSGDFNYIRLMTLGFAVGLLTGLVGAGGGFLIIPALVLFAKLPMKMAVGTSLLIIAVNSLIGVAGDLMGTMIFDWLFLITVTGVAIAGIFLGSYLSRFVPGQKLKPIFGWFVLLMGIYILTKELYLK